MSGSSDLETAFYGRDAEECEDFIRLVRIHAFKNRKANNDVWISEQVYLCFAGKALRWYLKQPRDVRSGWELLQQALIQEWPSVDDDRSFQPTPAAALPSAGIGPQEVVANDPVAPRTGRVCVKVPGGPPFLGCLSMKLAGSNSYDRLRGSFVITTDIRESLKATVLPTDASGIWRLGVKDVRGVKYLVAYFRGDFKNAAGILIGAQHAPAGPIRDSTTYAAASAVHHGHIYYTDVWEIGSQGTLNLRWPEQTECDVIVTAWPDDNNLTFQAILSSDMREADLFVDASS